MVIGFGNMCDMGRSEAMLTGLAIGGVMGFENSCARVGLGQ